MTKGSLQDNIQIQRLKALNALVGRTAPLAYNGLLEAFFAQKCKHMPTCTDYIECIARSENAPYSTNSRIYYDQSWTRTLRCARDHLVGNPALAHEVRNAPAIDSGRSPFDDAIVMVISCPVCRTIVYAYDTGRSSLC